jgi:fructose-specific PTS system IIB-like component
MKFVAVTSCPSGVAHTYMAAEAFEKEAGARGIKIKVETQGSIGVENEIQAEDLVGVDFVILTKDVAIKGRERFSGIPTANVNIGDAIKNTSTLFDKIMEALAKKKK